MGEMVSRLAAQFSVGDDGVQSPAQGEWDPPARARFPWSSPVKSLFAQAAYKTGCSWSWAHQTTACLTESSGHGQKKRRGNWRRINAET